MLNEKLRDYGAAYLLPLLSESGKRFALESYRLQKKHLDAISPLGLPFEVEKQSIDGLLCLADDATRFGLFSNLALLLSNKGYWYALGQAYTGSDWLDQVPNEWKRLFFSSSKPHREFLMSEGEQNFYNSLPRRFRIYRGMSTRERDSDDFGISWTLSEERANFFANDYLRHAVNYEKVVHCIELNREDIIAYFNGRGEEEVIYIPGK